MLVRIPIVVGERTDPADLSTELIVEEALIETTYVLLVGESSAYPNCRRIHIFDRKLDTPLELKDLQSVLSSGSDYTLELTPQQQLAINFVTNR